MCRVHLSKSDSCEDAHWAWLEDDAREARRLQPHDMYLDEDGDDAFVEP